MADGFDGIDVEAELERFEAEARKDLGLDATTHWVDEMGAPVFTASQRPKTTLLVGGLTRAQDQFVAAALSGIGYDVRHISEADEVSLRYGKEFGNRGQCNPTHFTVGNLVKELIRLRDEEGMSSKDIVDRYAFLTAGACGPCRFGMYVTEYRKSLRDAGFEGFRVLLFQQAGGIKQATGEELGLVLNPTFFFALAKAMFIGDVINLMAYRLRPYEVVAGSVDIAIEKVKKEVHDALRGGRSVYAALYRGRKILEAVEIDRLRPKPSVAIIGEFWAMTTEGDGNYRLQSFLEQEGSEVVIQVLAATLLYNLWEFRYDTLARVSLRGADKSRFGIDGTDVGLMMGGLYAGEIALRVWWQSFAKVLGLTGYTLPDMDEVERVGKDHYHVELRGGEGHLEVSKLILNVIHQKAHMTVGVKPFGCMPSSGVSDGIQSRITEIYPDAIYCPVETSGDGAVNFYSRVQMYLFKARQRAREQYEQALSDSNVTEQEVRDFLKSPAGRRWNQPFSLPRHMSAGVAADIVREVGPLVHANALERTRILALRKLSEVTEDTQVAAVRWGTFSKELAPYLPALGRFVAKEVKDVVVDRSAKLSEKVSIKKHWSRLFDHFTKFTEEEEKQLQGSERPGRSLPVVQA